MKKLQLTEYYRTDPTWWKNLCVFADEEFKNVNAILKQYNAEYVLNPETSSTKFDNYVLYETEEELLMCILKYS